jgi:hypothetical protein
MNIWGCTKSFRTGCLEWELQMVQHSATRCSRNTILWVSLVSFATITLCVASQQVFIVVVSFVINSVWKHLDTPLYSTKSPASESQFLRMTSSIEQSFSWEATTWLASQKISHFSLNLKDHHHDHEHLPQSNPVHTLTPYFFIINFNIILHYRNAYRQIIILLYTKWCLLKQYITIFIYINSSVKFICIWKWWWKTHIYLTSSVRTTC